MYDFGDLRVHADESEQSLFDDISCILLTKVDNLPDPMKQVSSLLRLIDHVHEIFVNQDPLGVLYVWVHVFGHQLQLIGYNAALSFAHLLSFHYFNRVGTSRGSRVFALGFVEVAKDASADEFPNRVLFADVINFSRWQQHRLLRPHRLAIIQVIRFFGLDELCTSSRLRLRRLLLALFKSILVLEFNSWLLCTTASYCISHL